MSQLLNLIQGDPDPSANMPLLASQLIGVSVEAFAATGAFNTILDFDSLLFIDPALLARSSAPEMHEVRRKLSLRFDDVYMLLSHSKQRGDLAWRQAADLLLFPEVSGLCIGYSSRSTSGSGMGKELRDRLLATGKEIIDLGIQEPRLFELLGLFEDDIGSDRISDMVAGIGKAEFKTYTQRIITSLVGDCSPFISQDLPVNPRSGVPLLLVPQDVLQDLPVALNRSGVASVCHQNDVIREELNRLIGERWGNLSKLSKRELRDLFLRHPDVLRALFNQYVTSQTPGYSVARDPKGLVRWCPDALEAVLRQPLSLTLGPNPGIDEVAAAVRMICLEFKRYIEDCGLEKSLYAPGPKGKPLPESYAQRLLFAVADAHCQANNLDLTPEAESGRGPVDFKMSTGYSGRVLVEVKLSKNSKLVQGYKVQLPIYQRAERASRAFYVVLDLGGNEKRIRMLQAEIALANATSPCDIEVIVVDATRKASASKAE